MRRMLTVVVALAIMITTLATGAGEVTFGYHFTPGKSEKYRLKIDTDVNMTGMQAKQVASMEVTVACVSRKADAYAMTLTFNKVESSTTIAGSTTTDPNAMQMLGKSVGFTVNAHGDVSDIGPGPGFTAWPAVQQVMEPTLKNWYVYLPGTPVAVGGTWKRENYRDKSSAGAEFVTNSVFKFREMKKTNGRNIAMVDDDVTTELGGSTETPVGVFNLSGTGKGKFEFQFDTAAGLIRYFSGSMTTDMNMTPQSGGDAVSTSARNTIERTLIE